MYAYAQKQLSMVLAILVTSGMMAVGSIAGSPGSLVLAQPVPPAQPSPDSSPDPESLDDPAGDSTVSPADGSAGTTDGGIGSDGMSGSEPAAVDPTLEPAVEPSGRLSPVISDTVEGDDAGDDSLIADDVAPTIRVFEGENAEVRLGGLLQIHFAPFVGADSLGSNDDPATSEGFRLRRSRLGVEGLFREIRLLLVVNPLETDTEVGTVSSARVSFDARSWLRVSLGTTKVPFARAGLESSRALSTIERPLSVSTLSPERRLGMTAEGAVLGGKLAYLAGFMNATEGFEPGNRFGGFLYGARAQYAVWGRPDSQAPMSDGVAVGLGGLFEDGPATNRFAGAFDIMVAMAGASLKLEAVYDRTTPDDDPVTPPMLGDEVDRLGAFAEVAYTLKLYSLQPVVRVEFFDDNRDFDDAGDVLLISAGVNARLYPRTRVQLHYLGRKELESEERSNDAVILNVQGDF